VINALTIEIITGIALSALGAQTPRTVRSDTAMARAAAADSAHLREAMAPPAAREAEWKHRDWRDPSPHREGFVDAGGVQLHYLDWGGRGAAMVFVPGMGHTAHVFDDLAPRFTDSFHVVALTLRGHGGSSAPSHPYTVDSLALDVARALDALRLRDVILVGHSLGGHVANRVAILHGSRVARVIYLDAAKDSTGLAALRAAAPTVRPSPEALSRGDDARAHWAQRRLYFAFWSNAQEADYRAGRTAPEIPSMSDLYSLQDWRAVRQPQLDVCALDTPSVQFPWLAGRDRERMTSQIARYLADRFVPWERASCARFAAEARSGTLVIVPQSNHYVFLVSPEQTYVAMKRWLASRVSQPVDR